MYANPGSADKKQLYEWELKINAVKSHEDLQKLGQEMDNVWSNAKKFREIDQESKFDKLLAKSSTVREKLGSKTSRRMSKSPATTSSSPHSKNSSRTSKPVQNSFGMKPMSTSIRNSNSPEKTAKPKSSNSTPISKRTTRG